MSNINNKDKPGKYDTEEKKTCKNAHEFTFHVRYKFSFSMVFI